MLTSRKYWLVLTGDALCLAFSFAWVTWCRRFHDLSPELVLQHVILFALLIPLWLWVFHLCGFYEARHVRQPNQSLILSGVFISFLFSALFLYFVSGLYTEFPAPKTILLLSSFMSGALIYFWRDRVPSWIGALKGSPGLMERPDGMPAISAGVPQAGNFDDFLVLNRRLLLDPSRDGYHESLKSASLRGIPVMTNTALEAMQTGKIPLDEIESAWVVERVLAPHFTDLFYRVMKRAMDLAGALLILPLALVLGLFTAVWTLIFVGWPIFYTQKRIGKGKKDFTLIKFRTMVELKSPLPGLTQENDPRVPAAMRWIRRLHLDELPQLINIFKGEMSWVGPRPEQIPVTNDLESKIDFYWVRHIATPGLTGWAQVNMGYASDFGAAKERFAYDLYYLANRSVILDFSIVLRTMRNVLAADGR